MSNKKLVSLIMAVIVAMASWYINNYSEESEHVVVLPTDGKSMVVRYIDVGQGDCAFIAFPDGRNMLIDAGTTAAEQTLPEYLSELGVKKIDYVIGTHPHEDHIGGLDAVIDSFEIGQIYMPRATTTTKTYKDVLTAVKNRGLSVTTVKAGKNIIDEESIKAEFLAPNSEEYESLNDYSAVLKLQYGNTSFLFTGDAEAVSEKEMLNKYGAARLKSDVLKMGHHGSSTSSSEAFFEAVSPDVAVISCGADNDYGHPHRETRALLEKYKTETYRTDINGTVTAVSDGESIKFTTEK